MPGREAHDRSSRLKHRGAVHHRADRPDDQEREET
jgi:hypothetical protein